MLSEFLKRVRKDVCFRANLFLCLSLGFGAAYSIFLFVVSQTASSKWFFVMSIYYGLLSLSRVFIFKQIKSEKNPISQIKTMRACGCFLLLINLAVSTMMFLIIYGNQYVKHHEITVITLAAYTFSSLTVAIVSSVKFIRKNDYVYSCVKLVSLTSASVSLVTLTNTMLATFGEEEVLLRSIVLPFLSGAVSLFIIAAALLMIRKANSDLRNYKNERK